MTLRELMQYPDALNVGQILGSLVLGAIFVVALNSWFRQKRAWRKFKGV